MSAPSAAAQALPPRLEASELRGIFKEYDIDGGGHISESELRKAVEKITGTVPSKGAVRAILAEIDVDASGNIDEDEFIEFFGKMQDLCEMQEEVKRMSKRSTMLQTMVSAYFVVNFCAFCFFVILYVEDSAKTEESQTPQSDEEAQSSGLGRMGLVITGVSLGVALCLGLVLPIMRLQLGSPKEFRSNLGSKMAPLAKKVPLVSLLVPKEPPRSHLEEGGKRTEAWAPGDVSPEPSETQEEPQPRVFSYRNRVPDDFDMPPSDDLVLAAVGDEDMGVVSSNLPEHPGLMGSRRSSQQSRPSLVVAVPRTADGYSQDQYAQAQAVFDKQAQRGGPQAFNSFGISSATSAVAAGSMGGAMQNIAASTYTPSHGGSTMRSHASRSQVSGQQSQRAITVS